MDFLEANTQVTEMEMKQAKEFLQHAQLYVRQYIPHFFPDPRTASGQIKPSTNSRARFHNYLTDCTGQGPVLQVGGWGCSLGLPLHSLPLPCARVLLWEERGYG